MITKGKKVLVWVFNAHLERTINTMVIFTFRKYVRQVLSHFSCGIGPIGPVTGRHQIGACHNPQDVDCL